MSASIRLPIERSYCAVVPQSRRFPRPIVCGNIGIERREDWVNLSRFGMNNHKNLGWCLIHCKGPSKWRRAFFLHRTNLFCSGTFTGGKQQS